jgi:hyperosmotically inducible protein
MKKFALAISWTVPALFLATQSVAQTSTADRQSSASDSAEAVAPDNSKSNREGSNRTRTADSQSNSSADVDLAARIRKSVMADKNLSTYAHNVKIVAVNGTVTLNGVVRNSDEKAQIGAKAASVAGEEHVVNDLTVAAPK